MRAVVVDLVSWSQGRGAAAFAAWQVDAPECGLVVAVGAGRLPEDLAARARDRMLRVDAPLATWEGRTVADPGAGCPRAFGWSLALLDAVLRLQAEQGLTGIEIPSSGALGFALLQERATVGLARALRIDIRVDGLGVVDALRTGSPAAFGDLATFDMERTCLELCDRLLVGGASVADSIAGFVGAAAGGPPVLTVVGTRRVDATASAAPNGVIACIASEPGPLRQALRAAVGVLQSAAGAQVRLEVVAPDPLWEACSALVPETVGARVRRVADATAVTPGACIVLADAWSCSDLEGARLQAAGHALVVNDGNPAYAERRGWTAPDVVRRYDGTAAALHALLSSRDVAPPVARVAPEAAVPPAPGSRSRTDDEAVSTGGPLVSVVIPCFNAGRWLPATLDSVWRSDHPRIQVIVVDDGSSDPDTCRVLERLEAKEAERCEVLRLPFNQGLAAARNAGIARAAGEFVLCLDADDLLSPGFLRLAVAALQRSTRFDIVVPRPGYFDDAAADAIPVDTGALPVVGCIPLVGNAFDSGLFANRFSTASCLMRRTVWEALGGYDEGLRSYEDWQFHRRALAHGFRFVVTNGIHFFYRRRGDSMIHSPAMRARHSALHAEMASRGLGDGALDRVSLPALGVLAAPPGVAGSASGLLLSDLVGRAEEVERLRNSRIGGAAYRLSMAVSRLRRRFGR